MCYGKMKVSSKNSIETSRIRFQLLNEVLWFVTDFLQPPSVGNDLTLQVSHEQTQVSYDGTTCHCARELSFCTYTFTA